VIVFVHVMTPESAPLLEPLPDPEPLPPLEPEPLPLLDPELLPLLEPAPPPLDPELLPELDPLLDPELLLEPASVLVPPSAALSSWKPHTWAHAAETRHSAAAESLARRITTPPSD
jgi:hypothetical protein